MEASNLNYIVELVGCLNSFAWLVVSEVQAAKWTTAGTGKSGGMPGTWFPRSVDTGDCCVVGRDPPGHLGTLVGLDGEFPIFDCCSESVF